MRKSKIDIFTTFLFPLGGDPGGRAITLNVIWMERERCMCPSNYNRFLVIRTASAKMTVFTYRSSYCFPWLVRFKYTKTNLLLWWAVVLVDDADYGRVVISFPGYEVRPYRRLSVSSWRVAAAVVLLMNDWMSTVLTTVFMELKTHYSSINKETVTDVSDKQS